jgi:hypothetical protein
VPPGTKVEIVNPRNGKKVVAPVIDIGPKLHNDRYWGNPRRWPKHPWRGIDLTPKTAHAIGLRITDDAMVKWRFAQ